jgi:hypothetical protein
MTWCGRHPVVELVSGVYETGKRLSKAAMQQIEAQIVRLPSLEKWFVEMMPAMLREN